MTLHIDQLPTPVSDALERLAKEEGKSIPQVALEALVKGLASESATGKKRDLSRFRGKWIEDPAVNDALKQFEKIDEDLWR